MFTYPFILIALSAIAIPIAVHLFNFRRYRKVYFSNVAYLREVQQQTRKQSELVRYLLLAARILAIVFLVLAFAQPVIPGSGRQKRPGGTAVSIYLDNSFSMSNTNADGTLLEMGRAKVREIAAAYEPGDQFQLVTNDATGSQFRWLSRDEMLEALDEVEQSPATITLSEMGRKMYDSLRRSGAANKHCYLVSDFQKSIADLPLWESDTNIQTTMLALGGSSVGNLFIDTLSLNAPVYYRGNTLVAKVTVLNDGDEALDQVQLRLYADEVQRAIATADIPARGKAEVELKMLVDKDNMMQCRVELTDYPVTFDDKLFFSVNVNSRIRVLAIGRDNVYLDRLFLGDSAIRYTKMPESHIDYESLADNNLIILNEMTSVPSGLAQSVGQWADEGGTLLVVPSSSMSQGLNEALAMWHMPQLGLWVARKGTVATIDLDAPLFRNVFGGKVEELELPTLQGHWQCRSPQGTARSTIMAMADGSDYLTTTRMGSGRGYLFSAPLVETATDFVRQSMFVPTLYNMALYSKQMGRPYYTLGGMEPIMLRDNYERPHLKQEGASLDVLPDVAHVAGRTILRPRGQVTEAGNYLIEESDRREGVSFNYNHRESELDFYSPVQVADLIKDCHLEECGVVPNAQKSMEVFIRQQHDDRPLWRWCLLACLLMLLAEVVLVRLSRKQKQDAKS